MIEAHFDMTEKAAPGDNSGEIPGHCQTQNTTGTILSPALLWLPEFPAQFRLCEEIPPCHPELDGERDLGWMLWDMDYTDPENIQPLFFRARLQNGVLEIPTRNSGEVRG